MKGFKKDGKFRPTEKRNKSGITKKSFEDVHAEHMINQANAQKILLRHKENLKSDMQECTLCDQQFDKNDPLFDIRISRHVLGMHSKNRTIYSERTGSPSTPMGNHTYGDAKFVPVKEKRKDESIDTETIPMREGMKWAVIVDDNNIKLLEFTTLSKAREAVGSIKLTREFKGSYEDDEGRFFVKISNVSPKEYGNWVRETKRNYEIDLEESQNIVDNPEENEGIDIEFYRKNVIGRTRKLESINPDSISQGEEE